MCAHVLYRSPHLLEVRERIRINGRPLSRASFVAYFWDVYNKLSSSRRCHGDGMPSYFRFLTVMAFSVFLQEKVSDLSHCTQTLTLTVFLKETLTLTLCMPAGRRGSRGGGYWRNIRLNQHHGVSVAE